MLSSIVRIVATVRDPDFDAPWQAKSPSTITGTGVVLAGGRVLACAHAVANAAHVRLHRVTTDDACGARVVAVNHDCDLALLVPDETAWLATVEPARLGALPPLRTPIYMFGASEGMHWVRDGIVSKIDVVRYSHSQRHLLALVLDVDMDEAQGAGPVFSDDELVGICVQKVNAEDRVGEVVPASIIQTFLAGVQAERPPRVPSLGITTQNTHNPRLRELCRLPDDGRGVLVIDVDHGGSADGVLARGDVIVAIDGIAVTANGTIAYAEVPPHRFDAIVGEHHLGDRIAVDIFRDGARRTVELELRAWLPLVPRTHYDRCPDYLVWGGLVFQPLTRDYLTTWSTWWNEAPKEFLDAYYRGRRTPERHELVVLTQILADAMNTGYGHLYNEAIAAVNGQVPRDFAAFVETLEHATGLVRIETTSGGVIAMHAADIRAAMPRILETYQIPAARSLGRRLPGP